MSKRQKYERHYHEDGTLLGESPKSGTGVARSFGHYATEYWMQDGEPMGFIKINDGPLLAQVKFIYNGKYLSKKKYHALCDRDPKMPRFEDIEEYNYLAAELKRERTKQRQHVELAEKHGDPGAREKLESFCEKLLDGDTCREAVSWLKDRSRGQLTLSELQTTSESLRLVRRLYALGAKKVFAVGIASDRHGENSGKLVIALPKNPEKRRRVLRWCSKQAQSEGFAADPDIGQKYAFVMLD
jgi:hypothetical protein